MENNYFVIKVFNKQTDELKRVEVAIKETLKSQLSKINHEEEAYFIIKCNVNKMINLVQKYN